MTLRRSAVVVAIELIKRDRRFALQPFNVDQTGTGKENIFAGDLFLFYLSFKKRNTDSL